MRHRTIFEATDSAGDGLLVEEEDATTEVRVKFGRHRLGTLLSPEQRRALGLTLLKDIGAPVLQLRALPGGH